MPFDDTPTESETLLTVVVPSYNVSHKIGACLDSIDALQEALGNIEAVIVDDMSTDDTAVRAREFVRGRSWAKLIELSENTGSPSTPRNVGFDAARGKYVWFQDADDAILTEGAMQALRIAENDDCDIVRGPLSRVGNSETRTMNDITDWSDDWTREKKIEAIVGRSSANIMGPIRRDFLIRTGVRWDADIRLGEDILFLTSILLQADRIGYSGDPLFTYDARRVPGIASSTQRYGNRELLDHLRVWREVSNILDNEDIDFFELRGQVALGTALEALLKYCWEEITYENFMQFHLLASEHADVLHAYSLRPRLKVILEAVLSGDYEEFVRQSKLRLVVAGDDLKFINDGLRELRRVFEIRVDKWLGHDRHDTLRSERLLDWADVIHCEWLLGNAVWYSARKRRDQTLIVRGHRFEVTRDFGRRMNMHAVDVFQGVALPMLEDFASAFSVPRSKLALVHNYIRDFGGCGDWNDERRFELAVIGAVPARKGLHRALEVLTRLRQIDNRYRLTLYGKSVEDLAWIRNDPKERTYFAQCEEIIRSNGLGDAVNWAGWVDTKVALQRTGFLLSVSDHEGSHVSVAEALGTGVMALMLPWRGADYVYPGEYVCENVADIASRIIEFGDRDKYLRAVSGGMSFVQEEYGLKKFAENYVRGLQRVIE